MSLKALARDAEATIKSDTRPRKGGRLRYKAEFLHVLLWGMYMGWSDTSIAYHAETAPRTVYNYKLWLCDNPGEIFRFPILRHERRLTKGTSRWRCEVCNDGIDGSEIKARKHVASHFFSFEIIQLNGIADVD